MGDEVHQLTGWQALQKKKKKKGSHREGTQPMRPGSAETAGCGVCTLCSPRGREALSWARRAAAKAAWGAARGFSFFMIATALSGAALARSLRAEGPLETCVTATASHL